MAFSYILQKGDNDGAFTFSSLHSVFNSLPDYKILDWSILKQIADDILKCISYEK